MRIIHNQSSSDTADTIRLECILDGENTTKIYWTRVSHSKLPDHMSNDGGTLVIRSVSRKDGGLYRCHAETVAGVLTRDFLLTIPGEFNLTVIWISKRRCLKFSVSSDKEKSFYWVKCDPKMPQRSQRSKHDPMDQRGSRTFGTASS